jgi:hypothetical protein
MDKNILNSILQYYSFKPLELLNLKYQLILTFGYEMIVATNK